MRSKITIISSRSKGSKRKKTKEKKTREGKKRQPKEKPSKKQYISDISSAIDSVGGMQRMEFVGKHAKKISNNYASKYSKNVLKAPKAKAKATPTEKKMTFREMMESGDF